MTGTWYGIVLPDCRASYTWWKYWQKPSVICRGRRLHSSGDSNDQAFLACSVPTLSMAFKVSFWRRSTAGLALAFFEHRGDDSGIIPPIDLARSALSSIRMHFSADWKVRLPVVQSKLDWPVPKFFVQSNSAEKSNSSVAIPVPPSVSENKVASDSPERGLLVPRVTAVLLELSNPDDPVVWGRGGRGGGGADSWDSCLWFGEVVVFTALRWYFSSRWRRCLPLPGDSRWIESSVCPLVSSVRCLGFAGQGWQAARLGCGDLVEPTALWCAIFGLDVAACDVAGRPVSNRWLAVICECFASMPSYVRPMSLWLFTFDSPHDTLLRPALEIFWSMSSRGWYRVVGTGERPAKPFSVSFEKRTHWFQYRMRQTSQRKVEGFGKMWSPLFWLCGVELSCCDDLH